VPNRYDEDSVEDHHNVENDRVNVHLDEAVMEPLPNQESNGNGKEHVLHDLDYEEQCHGLNEAKRDILSVGMT
jgi:hypothetical protein